MGLKLTFFKSYYQMGWWAARVPQSAEWDGHKVEHLGFGVTQTQAERNLLDKEQSMLVAAGELAA